MGALRCFKHLAAGRRQLVEREFLARCGWRRMEHPFSEPVDEFLATALVLGHRRLVLAVGVASRAARADVLMIVVLIPGSHLVQPGAIGASILAQFLLDRGINKNPFDSRIDG